MPQYCPEIDTLYRAVWSGYLQDFFVQAGNCIAINKKWKMYDDAAWQALINEHGDETGVLEYLGVTVDMRDNE